MHSGAAATTGSPIRQRHGKPEPLLLMGFAAELCITCEEPADKKSAASSGKRHADTPEMHLGASTATVRHTWQRHGRPEPLLLMGFAAELCITFEEPADKKPAATSGKRHADTPL
jgi:hypothetical protein